MPKWVRDTASQMRDEFGSSVRKEAVKWSGVLGVSFVAGTTAMLTSENGSNLVREFWERNDGDTVWQPDPVRPAMHVTGLEGYAIDLSAQAVPVVLGSIEGSTGDPASMTQAPDAPVLQVTAYRDQGDSIWVDGDAPVLYNSDAHDSTAILVDTAGGDFSSPQYHADTIGAIERDSIGGNVAALDSGAVVDVIMAYKGLNGGWSEFDTLRGVAVTTELVQPDKFKPAAWNDTIHYEDFSQGAPVAFSTTREQSSGLPTGFTLMMSESGLANDCLGGLATSYSDDCKGLDSIQDGANGQLSPPWVWELATVAGGGGSMRWNFDFSAGNGTGAPASTVNRLYFRITMYHSTNFSFHPLSWKWWNLNQIDNGYFQLWYTAPFLFDGIDNLPDSEDGCKHHEANNWNALYPGDTIGPQINGMGTCTKLGLGGTNEVGKWQHFWWCIDYSPPSGSRVFSFGVVDADVEGIAGYHDNHTVWTDGDTVFEGLLWNGTIGGGANPSTEEVRQYFDDMLIMTGSSGTCIAP